MSAIITISAFQYELAGALSSSDVVELRVWYTGGPGENFLDADNNVVPYGSATNLYLPVDCTVSGGEINVDPFALSATDNSSNISSVVTAQFFINGAPSTFLFTDWIITNTLGAAISYASLYTYNLAAQLTYALSTLYLTAPQVAALIASTAGAFLDASATVKGITKLSVAPLSATNPIAIGNNDPRLTKLDSSGDLVYTGGIILSADFDATGTDTVQMKTRNILRFRINNDGTLTAVSTKLTLGDNTVAGGARVDMTFCPTSTATTGRLGNLWTQTFAQINGPGGEPNYDDDEMVWSYNTSTSGAKTVAGIKDFGWYNEARYYSGGFQSEHYFQYRNPDGTVTIRPFGWTVTEAASAVQFTVQGRVSFMRDAPNQATQTAIWYESGALELLTASAAFIIPNNINGFLGKNAAGNNIITIAKINATDKVVIAPDGGETIITANLDVPSITGIATMSGQGDADTFIQFAGGDVLRLTIGGTKVADFNSFLTWFSNKHVGFEQDNTYDFGQFNSTNYRPRTIYAGTSLAIAGGTPLTTTNQTGTGSLVLAASPTLTGTPAIAAATGTSLLATGLIKSSGTAGIGYATGAGGTVTQATNKSTGVTLDKTTGTIIMNNAALNAGISVAFTLTNSTIAATDVIIVNLKSGNTANSYTVSVDAVAAGSCSISLRNYTAGNLSEAVVLSFAVIKGVAA